MKNKLIYALLSFVIALGLWFYVITVVSPESEEIYYNIPVIMENESVMMNKGLMNTAQKDPTVTLRLKGNRSDLNNLKNSDISLIADLSKINQPGEQRVNFDISFPGSFADNAFEVLSYSPDKLILDIVEWASKEVDVLVEFTGTTPPEYIVYKDDCILSQEKITVAGPKAVVEKITHAQVNVDLEGRIDTINSRYPFELCYETENDEQLDFTLVKTDVDALDLTVKIQRVKDLQLVLDVVYGGGATDKNTSIVLSQETIKVSGSESVLEALGDTLVLDSIHLAEILTNETREYEILLPGDVDNLSGLDKVTVTISFSNLETKDLQVSNIDVYNVPAGLQVKDIGTKVCNIMLRGPKSLIQKITAADIEIRVNLENAVEGTELYKADVVITNSNYAAVGAVSSYSIAVELTSDT